MSTLNVNPQLNNHSWLIELILSVIEWIESPQGKKILKVTYLILISALCLYLLFKTIYDLKNGLR
jgi:hypothetical protein